mmetsp:Transcript_36582/g.44153  ORF Transcript_36582/g.44153 Transcript_36582/m.44153 type:complete len:716 (+) Transcript_36582:69-2216(+)
MTESATAKQTTRSYNNIKSLAHTTPTQIKPSPQDRGLVSELSSTSTAASSLPSLLSALVLNASPSELRINCALRGDQRYTQHTSYDEKRYQGDDEKKESYTSHFPGLHSLSEEAHELLLDAVRTTLTLVSESGTTGNVEDASNVSAEGISHNGPNNSSMATNHVNNKTTLAGCCDTVLESFVEQMEKHLSSKMVNLNADDYHTLTRTLSRIRDGNTTNNNNSISDAEVNCSEKGEGKHVLLTKAHCEAELVLASSAANALKVDDPPFPDTLQPSGLLSPVLGTEALYQQAGWTTPIHPIVTSMSSLIDSRKVVGENDVDGSSGLNDQAISSFSMTRPSAVKASSTSGAALLQQHISTTAMQQTLTMRENQHAVSFNGRDKITNFTFNTQQQNGMVPKDEPFKDVMYKNQSRESGHVRLHSFERESTSALKAIHNNKMTYKEQQGSRVSAAKTIVESLKNTDTKKKTCNGLNNRDILETNSVEASKRSTHFLNINGGSAFGPPTSTIYTVEGTSDEITFPHNNKDTIEPSSSSSPSAAASSSIPKSMTEIYKISNRNKRQNSKKKQQQAVSSQQQHSDNSNNASNTINASFDSSVENMSACESDSQQDVDSITEAEHILSQRGGPFGFDKCFDKRTNTYQQGLPNDAAVNGSNMDDANGEETLKQDNISFMKEIGWIESNEEALELEDEMCGNPAPSPPTISVVTKLPSQMGFVES